MGKQKLTDRIVRNIKKMLLERNEKGKKVYTHQDIADKINQHFRNNHKDPTTTPKQISRETITKINLGLKNEQDKNARWVDTLIDKEHGE